MPHETRKANRTQRQYRTGKLNTRNTEYYLIITDAKETEQNYLNGLKDSLNQSQQKRISIKIIREKKPANLVKECLKIANLNERYEAHLWILLDRDEVSMFDEIIEDARENGINVAWSNPCIEIWFSAYFENIKSHTNSKQCISEFKILFNQKTGYPYHKNDSEIYKRLTQFGDEDVAIQRMKQKRKEYADAGITTASKMTPATEVDLLISEIKKIVEDS